MQFVPADFPAADDTHASRVGDVAWGPYSLTGMTITYFLVFLFYVVSGFYQLHSRPYSDVRPANILFRLQVQLNQHAACREAAHVGLHP